MGITHLALDLSLRGQSGHRVNNDELQGTRADEGVSNLESLLTIVRLAHQQGICIDPEFACVFRVESVLGVNKGTDAAFSLGISDCVQSHRRLAGGFGTIDLHDPATWEASDTQRDVEGHRARGDSGDLNGLLLAKAHDRALAVLLLDLLQGRGKGLFAVSGRCHVVPSSKAVSRPI